MPDPVTQIRILLDQWAADIRKIEQKVLAFEQSIDARIRRIEHELGLPPWPGTRDA